MLYSGAGHSSLRRPGFVGALLLAALLGAAGLFLAAVPAGAALPPGVKLLPVPEQGRVADGAGLLTQGEIDQLNATIQRLDAQNGVEIGVATVQSAAPLTPEEYATALFAQWGIGKKGADNGLLVLIALKERRIKVEVGYGLEGILPDGRVGRLLDDYAMPSLRQGRYGAGLVSLTTELAKIAAAEYEPGAAGEAPRQAAPRRSAARAPGTAFGTMAFLLFLFFMFAVQALNRPPGHVCPRCKGRMVKEREETVREATPLADGLRRVEYRCPRCGYDRVAEVVIPMLIAGALSSGRRRGPWDGGFGGFGGFGGGGDSGGGGFGGFGGGSSGGGGAGRDF